MMPKPGFFDRFRRAAAVLRGADWDKVPVDVDSLPNAAGVAVTPSRTIGLPGVLCAVRTVSETLAMLPLLVYERTPDGGKDRARNHPVYRLLRKRVNRYQTAMEWKSLMQSWAMLFGNAYAEVVRNRVGDVVELLPLHPLSVTMDVSGDAVVYRHQGARGQERVLSADRVFHLSGFSVDGLLGLSPLRACRDALGIALALSDFAGAFFKNGTWPGLVIMTPAGYKLSDEQHARLKTQFREEHQGARRSNKNLLLEGGLTATKMTPDPETSQALESRVFSVQDVARIFGIPPHLLMDLSGAIKSNISEQALQFKAALLPWGERWAQRVDTTLLDTGDSEGYFSGWVWDGLVQSDLETRYAAYAVAKQNGWLNADEIRERENLNPLPNGAGQEYLKALNLVEAGASSKPKTDQDDEAA
jgi:HK97 family phage portal protein